MNEYQKVALAIAAGAAALGGYFIVKAFQGVSPSTPSKFEVGDVISCYYGDAFDDFYTVIAKKFERGEWQYLIGVGKHTTVPDVGWRSESMLWSSMVTCYLLER